MNILILPERALHQKKNNFFRTTPGRISHNHDSIPFAGCRTLNRSLRVLKGTGRTV